MRFPEAFDGSFGQLHFGDAPLEPRRVRRLVRLADQFLAHPQGTLPHKISDPQNRPSDGAPSWLTLWRGWVKLQSMLTGAALAASKRSGGT